MGARHKGQWKKSSTSSSELNMLNSDPGDCEADDEYDNIEDVDHATGSTSRASACRNYLSCGMIVVGLLCLIDARLESYELPSPPSSFPRNMVRGVASSILCAHEQRSFLSCSVSPFSAIIPASTSITFNVIARFNNFANAVSTAAAIHRHAPAVTSKAIIHDLVTCADKGTTSSLTAVTAECAQ